MAFEFLRGLARPSRPSKTPDAPPPPPTGVEAEIYVLLKRAFAARCLLTVYAGPAREAYTSAILEVVRDQRYMVLDELSPGAGHEHIVTSRDIEVRALVEGVELRFRSEVLQIGQHDGLPFYKVAFPREIAYAQKRQQYRVPVPLHQGFDVSLVFSDEREAGGELRDISFGGLSVRIRNGHVNQESDRNALAMCRLAISKEHSIITDVEILHVHAAQKPRVPRIGARFVDLSPTTARRIEQFCAELERLRSRG